MNGPSPSVQAPIGRGIARVGLILTIVFALIAVGAGYWQVVRASELSRAPDNPLVIAAARNAIRGKILDRFGAVLATNRNDANGEPYRIYADQLARPADRLRLDGPTGPPAWSGPTTPSCPAWAAPTRSTTCCTSWRRASARATTST